MEEKLPIAYHLAWENERQLAVKRGKLASLRTSCGGCRGWKLSPGEDSQKIALGPFPTAQGRVYLSPVEQQPCKRRTVKAGREVKKRFSWRALTVENVSIPLDALASGNLSSEGGKRGGSLLLIFDNLVVDPLVQNQHGTVTKFGYSRMLLRFAARQTSAIATNKKL